MESFWNWLYSVVTYWYCITSLINYIFILLDLFYSIFLLYHCALYLLLIARHIYLHLYYLYFKTLLFYVITKYYIWHLELTTCHIQYTINCISPTIPTVAAKFGTLYFCTITKYYETSVMDTHLIQCLSRCIINACLH